MNSASQNVSNSNISAITAIEQQAIASRSFGERVSDAVARQAGRLWFVAAHAVWFVLWIAASGGAIQGVRAFDPFPYPFLTFVLSLESIFLSLFILMSQNRAGKQADSRSHLDLQINMLAEQESTKALEMLYRICEFHGLNLDTDDEMENLKRATKPGKILEELKKSLPKEC